MKILFIQEVLNTMMFKKLTTVFPFLRKEKLTENDLKDAVKDLERQGLIDALKKGEQDPKELAEMALIAFDDASKKARERMVAALNQIADHIAK